MEKVIDIRVALEQLGTGWQFGGSVTACTQQAWDAVVWEDEREKPSWEELCAAHAGIESKKQKEAMRVAAQTALDKSDLVALRCFKNGVPFPTEWVTYCAALRSIAVSGVGPVPVQPDYPKGS